MSEFKDLGAKPKDKQKTKRWSLLPPSKKQHNILEKNKELRPHENYDSSVKSEINRLEDVNKRYENDYCHQRKMMLFNLYEQQYLLETKTNYLSNQQKLISAINAENTNIMATISMYNNRIKMNNEHILTLDEGTKNMELYSQKLRDEITASIKKIENLDNNRRDAVRNNSELRIKYLNLLKSSMEKDRRKKYENLQHPEGCKPILDIVKELEYCYICYNKMTPKVFSCRQSHSICSNCYDKIGDRCPFCSIQGPMTRNRIVENLIKATAESKAISKPSNTTHPKESKTKL